MFARLARAIFGNANDRVLKAYQRRVPAITALEPAMAALSDADLAAKTVEFRKRIEERANRTRIVEGRGARVCVGAVEIEREVVDVRRERACRFDHRRDCGIGRGGAAGFDAHDKGGRQTSAGGSSAAGKE